MKRRGAWFIGVAVLTAACHAQPLEQDPRLTTGTLDNGLSYVLMSHATPPARAGLWMHVHSGSLNETDKQRGLAHFLEHMAFNGSDNFPPGSVIGFFQSLGMTFGRDQNAFTSFDQTTYQLSLPDNTVESLDKGLLFFADVGSRLLLKDEEIEAERGVILNERTTRLSAQQRLRDYILERSAPGSVYARRSPIGTEESLQSVSREDFVEYYKAWYTPANTTLIVVADMEPGAVLARVKAALGGTPVKDGDDGEADSPPASTPRPTPADPGIRPYEASFGVVASDPELTRASVRVSTIGKPTPAITTEELQREEWVQDLAQAAFNRRMSDLVALGGTPFRSAGVSAGNQGRLLYTAAANATGAPERWRDMLTMLVQEVQRARVHGLSQRELDESRTDVLAGFEQSARTEGTLPARAYLSLLNNALTNGRTLQSSSQRAELAKRLMPGITLEECNEAFVAQFDFSRAMFTVQLPSAADNPTEADVLKAGFSALTREVEPPVEATLAEGLMETLPKPGEVVESVTHEASGVHSAWLSNNVRVHHRFMEERKGQASVTISLIGGELDETSANRGVTTAAALGIGGSGGGGRFATRSLTSSDIRSLMAGKNVRVGGRAGLDLLELGVSGNPEDLEAGLQLAHLLLTEPRIEAPAFDRWRESTLENLASLETNPLQMFAKVEGEIRYPANEVRGQFFTVPQVRALTLDAAQSRLEKLIADSPIEVAIVGDIPRGRALELAARYLGSLASRPRVDAGLYLGLRTLPPVDGPRESRVEVNTQTPQAGASVSFYGPDEANVRDVRAMRLAASILSTRMVKRIREELALVYSIGCGVSPGAAFPGYGLVRAGSLCRPDNADKLPAAIQEVFDAFAKDGPTPEELETARKQVANTLDVALREPGTWAGRLGTLTYDGLFVEEILNDPAAYQGVSAETILETFNRYYKPERVLTVVVKPVVATPVGD